LGDKLRGIGRSFNKSGLVYKEVFVKDSGGTCGFVLGAHTEDVVWVATEHAATEAMDVTASESSNGVSWIVSRGVRLVAGHSVLGRGNEDTDRIRGWVNEASNGRNIISGRGGNRRWAGWMRDRSRVGWVRGRDRRRGKHDSSNWEHRFERG
jgi:hypothetical protein